MAAPLERSLPDRGGRVLANSLLMGNAARIVPASFKLAAIASPGGRAGEGIK